MQQQTIISVPVRGGRVDAAMKTLRRKVNDEGLRQTWKAQSVYVKPSEKRKEREAKTKRMLQTQKFREKLRWILRKTAKGF